MIAAVASATGIAGLPSVAQRRCNACKARTPKAIGSRSPGLRGQQLQSQSPRSPLLELRAKPATCASRTARVQVNFHRNAWSRYVCGSLLVEVILPKSSASLRTSLCQERVIATCSSALAETIMLCRPVRRQPWWLHHQQTRPKASNGART